MQFKLPELGEGVNEGELVKWRVKPGDEVKHDQALCEIMTDKATIEIPSAFDGKVSQLHAKEGDVVQPGQVMITFEGHLVEGAEAVAPEPKAESKPQVVEPQARATAERAPQPEAAPAVGPVLASPSTRRLAREAGVELGRIRATGPHGRILREDVEHALRAPGAPMGGEERVPFHGLRKRISEKMRLSKDKAAHYTYVEEADATELVKLRLEAKAIGEKQGIKVTYLPFVMKAMVSALREYPIVNSSLDEEKGELVYKHYYNIGLSIQTDDGLTAPVVKDVANKPILQLAHEIQDLVERARRKQLALSDFQGGTITLTNAGNIGGLFATPVINYPEVAILGFNKIFRKPVAKMVSGVESVVIRDWTYFSASFDHRIVDGAVGAEFIKSFIRYIENPALILL